jgi:hypothetical protein
MVVGCGNRFYVAAHGPGKRLTVQHQVISLLLMANDSLAHLLLALGAIGLCAAGVDQAIQCIV